MTVPDRTTFENIYAGQPPWDIGRPQKAFLDVADRITGTVLDAGCGTGENALFYASRGQKVTGIDFLAEPIIRAKKKAAERGVTATFLVMDALALNDLPEVFDSVIDSGLFHVFNDDNQWRYVEGLATVLKPGGRLFLLCISDDEPGTQGPRRVSRKELHAAFAEEDGTAMDASPDPGDATMLRLEGCPQTRQVGSGPDRVMALGESQDEPKKCVEHKEPLASFARGSSSSHRPSRFTPGLLPQSYPSVSHCGIRI